MKSLRRSTFAWYKEETEGYQWFVCHGQERQRIFLILETISSQLDAEDSRAAAAAASKLNTTGNRTGDTSPGAEGGWWDDLPEAPTGAPSSVSSKTSAERRLPPGPPPPYTANVQPSAPPADAEGPSEDWGGGSNLGYGGGGVGVGGGKGMVPGDGVDDLAFQNALRTLSLDQVCTRVKAKKEEVPTRVFC